MFQHDEGLDDFNFVAVNGPEKLRVQILVFLIRLKTDKAFHPSRTEGVCKCIFAKYKALVA